MSLPWASLRTLAQTWLRRVRLERVRTTLVRLHDRRLSHGELGEDAWIDPLVALGEESHQRGHRPRCLKPRARSTSPREDVLQHDRSAVQTFDGRDLGYRSPAVSQSCHVNDHIQRARDLLPDMRDG